MSFQDLDLNNFGYIPRIDISGSQSSSPFNFLRNSQSVFKLTEAKNGMQNASCWGLEGGMENCFSLGISSSCARQVSSRELYCVVPVGDNTVLCTSQCSKRVYLSLSVFKTKQKLISKTTKTAQRVTKKLQEEKGIFITLIVVMTSQVYAYVQTPQIVYIRYVHSFVYQSYLNKAAFFFFSGGVGGAGSPSGPDGKESACNARNPSSLPGSGRSPGEQNGYPLQYSCLENSMDIEETGRLQSLWGLYSLWDTNE